MTQYVWTRDGRPVDACAFDAAEWESLKLAATLGDFVLPCCRAPAVLKTSINGTRFFARLSDECATAPETKWHHGGKAAVLGALHSLRIDGGAEVPGRAPSGEQWKADILFASQGRTIAIELQRSYQHLRDFLRRQQRYAESGVECYWLVRKETFLTLVKATSRTLLARDFNGQFPPEGIGNGLLAELPVAILSADANPQVIAGGMKQASVQEWISGILAGTYRYRRGTWYLD